MRSELGRKILKEYHMKLSRTKRIKSSIFVSIISTAILTHIYFVDRMDFYCIGLTITTGIFMFIWKKELFSLN